MLKTFVMLVLRMRTISIKYILTNFVNGRGNKSFCNVLRRVDTMEFLPQCFCFSPGQF